MAQNEMQGRDIDSTTDSGPSAGRAWLDLNRVTLWQAGLLIAAAFAVGGAFGWVLS